MYVWLLLGKVYHGDFRRTWFDMWSMVFDGRMVEWMEVMVRYGFRGRARFGSWPMAEGCVAYCLVFFSFGLVCLHGIRAGVAVGRHSMHTICIYSFSVGGEPGPQCFA